MSSTAKSNRKPHFRRGISNISPTAPYEKLPPVEAHWLLRRLQGHHETLIRAAEYIIEQIQIQGARFKISSRQLGSALGMSQSTGSRCLRKLRSLGLILLYRAHHVRFVRRTKRWTGIAAVHEVMLINPDDSPIHGASPKGESSALTWENGATSSPL